MDSKEKDLLLSHSRWLAHMLVQIEKGRFGLVLGAGVSKPLNFPNWGQLVERIAKHPEVQGEHILSSAGRNLSETSKTQMLFLHYRTKNLEKTNEQLTSKSERRIQGQWRRIIHSALYEGVSSDPTELRDRHPYLKEWIPVILKSGMTVNYNFDDTIQQLIILDKPAHPGTVRAFETVWNAYLPFRSESAILYHPNGFLPRNLLENPSESLVFSEESFADQLIESMAGHHASLIHHLSKTTCIFIGLSLSDPTLRHLLRQSAVINPGHYHYYVQHMRPGDKRDVEVERSVRDANFEVYNLITLFLNDEEIAALGRLLTLDNGPLLKESEELGAELSYVFYLSGPIGAGKTTTLGYFGSFKTYEEWTEVRRTELAKPWKDLTKVEREFVDDWIARQFEIRNTILIKHEVGIHICDRTPLDPICFNEDSEVPAKARFLAEHLRPGKSGRKAQGGKVILLIGTPDELEARVVGRHKQSPSALIADLQQRLQRIFSRTANVAVVDTSGMSIPQVVKQVSRIVLLDEYAPFNLADRLVELEKNGLSTSE